MIHTLYPSKLGRLLVLATLALGFAGVARAQRGATPYTLLDLGSFMAYSGDPSIATNINGDGQVIGQSFAAFAGGFPPHCFLTEPDTPIEADDDLNASGSGTAFGTGCFAYGLNSLSHVTGAGYIVDGPFGYVFTAFFEHDGAMIPMGRLEDGYYSIGYAINDLDDIVGIAADSAFPSGHATIWPHGSSTPFDLNAGLPPGSTWSLIEANDINDAGMIVGYGAPFTFGALHAFLLPPGFGASPVDLGTLGGMGSAAWGINAFGSVVGFAELPSGNHDGFVWIGGVMTDLGTLPGFLSSEATGINSSGMIVGWAENLISEGDDSFTGGTDPEDLPFLYNNGVMSDLNKLIPPGSGLTLISAVKINDSGQIVGLGFDSTGVFHGVELSPTGILAKLSLKPAGVKGGKKATGTVTLAGPAPPGGAVVRLTNTNPAASVPASVIVPAGKKSAKFTITTTKVTTTMVGTITAGYLGVTLSSAFTVKP